ncbi:diguanylate cyclase [Glaciihabitans sp. dw_435]|uniref:GGDEF domain-containing protein n=1 Tax=Glaciihabitans sp. dw_435 TaxID=2720081 RepID=UPI001BD553D1|nr:diguanylate cyclase [Glaciihabitans sp. dw_435]
MIIDSQTLLLASGAVVTIAGFSFILNTILRRNDDVGRSWSIAFVCGILATFSYAVWGFVPGAWWAIAFGNAALVLSLGAMWAGCRQYNLRRSLIQVPMVAAVIVGLAVIVRGPDGGDWAGGVEMFLGIAAFSVLAGAETLRARMQRSVNARILTVVFLGVGGYYVARIVVFLVDGEDGTLFTTWFGTNTTTFVTIMLVILASISMSILTSGRTVRAGQTSLGTGLSNIPGIVNHALFDQLAKDWLSRAKRDRDALALILLDVDNLTDMNTAFGRDFGDRAIYRVGRIACEQSPSAALIGHDGARQFAVLTTVPSVGSPITVAEHIHTALVETPIDPVEGVRAISTCGLATTDDYGYDFGALIRAANAAIITARAHGSGSIAVALPER